MGHRASAQELTVREMRELIVLTLPHRVDPHFDENVSPVGASRPGGADRAAHPAGKTVSHTFLYCTILFLPSPQDADEERLCYLSDDGSSASRNSSPTYDPSPAPVGAAEADAAEALLLLHSSEAPVAAVAASPKSHAQPARPKSCLCDLCGMSFLNKQGLYYHRRQLHAAEGLYNRFSCCHCGQGFKVEGHLHRHQSLCQGQPLVAAARPKSFSCDLCSRSFSHKQSLYQHRRLAHVTEGLYNRFSCSYCGQGFKAEGFLDRHQALRVCFRRFR